MSHLTHLIYYKHNIWVRQGVASSTVNPRVTKRIIHHYSPFQIVFYPMLFAVPLLYICAFLFDEPMIKDPGGTVLAAILYQALVTGSFGFVAWNSLLQRYGAVSLHTFIFIMPVVGVLLGGLILKEPITSNILMALAFIGIGIFVTQFTKKKVRTGRNGRD